VETIKSLVIKKKKILIVDIYWVVIEGIKSILTVEPEFEVVGEAFNGREVFRKLKSLRPDIVIIDITLPCLENRFDIISQIKSLYPDIRIIVFTMAKDEQSIIGLFRIGIAAYVLKEAPLQELAVAVKAVNQGGAYFSPQAYMSILNHLAAAEKASLDTNELKDLSIREKEVFRLMAEGRTTKEIAAVLNISPQTVKSHHYKVMKKLNIHNSYELTRLAIRTNIIQV